MRYIGRIVGIVVGVLLAMVVVYAALLFNSARILKSELEQAVKVASSSNLSVDVSGAQNGGGQFSEIKSAVPQLQEHTGKARKQADGVVWRIATIFPYIGDDFTAARTATDAFDTLAQQALPSLIDAANTMQESGLSNGDGSFNVKSLSTVSSKIGGANTVLQQQVTALHQAPTPHIGQVRDALKTGTGILDSLAGTISSYSDTITSLNALFGHDGTRHYLILSQSNAGMRSAGGIVGSVGTVTVSDGKVTLGDFYSNSKFTMTEPVKSTDEINKMYAISRLGLPYGGDIRIASATPNFPEGAAYAKEVWAGQSFGSDDIDGVLSFDIAALQSLIGVTGNVTLSTGQTLTADNTAQYLSNQVYIDIPSPQDEDRFFEESAQRIIGGALSGINADKAMKLVGVLPKMAKERHIYLWSFDQQDQSALRAAGMTGEISQQESAPTTGVYSNEMGWTKSDWYVQRSATIKRTSLGKDGSASYHVSYTITNSMTSDQAKTLPQYITGTFPVGMMNNLISQSKLPDDQRTVVNTVISGLSQPGVVGHSLAIAQPAGGTVTNIKLTSNSPTQVPKAQEGFDRITSNGVIYYVNLATLISPGSTATLEYDVSTAPGASPLQFDQTPTVGDPKIEYDYQR
ncbi:DUF4012 domain-containing protein [Bifidobacterium tissieri]|uniref:DUF4012 domain-containing protein n=1 Tax=Bifidobacterium tissieri TaxID=1630162 RepID=A0A5M9ZNT9_9BIFI|nr:DUF4012 domain-containing protein [Bifidobacterium tissieri]KAA8829301.1 DUF4012 domain-containing protein [Bifidobacterium tissieri]KAA8831905.1 DUF4012 domain-containing protein [Bifidobacterium tissieri]